LPTHGGRPAQRHPQDLEREVNFRLLARNKQAAMDALVAQADLDLPKSSVQAELDRMVAGARADLKQRGVKDADKAPIREMFRPQAERRVRLGLVVRAGGNQNLDAKPEQVKATWKSWLPATRAGRRGALVLQRQPPHGRGGSGGDRETTSPTTCCQGQDRGQGACPSTS